MGFKRFLLVGVIGIAALGLPQPASASLIGQNVTVTFSELGFADVVDIVMVGAGPEIEELDGTNIGDDILLGGEFIDIGDASIQYMVRGDGPGGTTGFGAGSFYEFTNLFWSGPVPGIITDVTVDLVDVNGVAVGPGMEVTFTPNSVKLLVDTLTVDDDPTGGPDLGLITLNLAVEHTQVPEPSTLGLSLLGLVGLIARRWRRIR